MQRKHEQEILNEDSCLCDDIRYLTGRALWETENLIKCILDEFYAKVDKSRTSRLDENFMQSVISFYEAAIH